MKLVTQAKTKARRQGSAVIVVIALLSLLLLYVAYNLRTLHLLGQELRLIERQQLRRLAAVNANTNAVAVTNATPVK